MWYIMADTLRVLYVDDEPGLLTIGKLFLERGGSFAVDTLTSALDALEQLKTEQYDAIISDYQMPEMDGIAFLKQLKAGGNTTPFIIFTGRGREEVVIEALNEGADFYIQKGGEPKSQFAELTHKIKIGIERKRGGDARKQDEGRLLALVTFYQMTSAPLKELMNFAVEKAVEISASSIGYLAVVSDDEALHTMYAWSAQSMKECNIDKKTIEYPIDATGLWGEAVRQRRPVITNNYAAESPLKRGPPEGHVPIIRHMNIPVFDGNHIVMVAGVGNKTSDYDERDVQELSLMMSGLWNVVKQRKAEAELEASVKGLKEASLRYKALIAASNTGAWENHSDSGFLWCSPEYFSMLGRDINDFDLSGARNIEQVWINLLHPEDRERAIRHFEAYLDNPVGMYEQHFRMLHKDGHWLWICSRGKTVRDANGEITSITVGTHIDVTEQKQAEEALGNVVTSLKMSQQVAHVGNWILDLNNNVFDASEEALQLFGYPPDYHPAFPEIVACIHPDDRTIAHEALTRLFETGEPYTIDIRIFRHDTGELRFIHSKGQVLNSEKGSPVSVFGINFDITERKRVEEGFRQKNQELEASYEQVAATEEELRANLETMTGQERQLRESEEKFRTLFESAGDGILIMDHTVFLDCNRRTNEIYQRTRDQIIGHTPSEFSPERQPDGQLSAGKMKKKIDAAFLGENRFFEWVHVHKYGTPFIVEVSLNRFMVRGTFYLQAIVRDITERKQNDEQNARMSDLKVELLGSRSLQEQLKLVSDSCVRIFGADFARIWLIKDADLCNTVCRHASVTAGPEVCRNRYQCLHLMASSGRYTHIDGGHQRVPFGCYKIGRVASGEDPFFITNDVVHDIRVHDHAWAQSCGLVSFAGFRLLSQEKRPVGVLALFRDREIFAREEKLLVDLANTLSQVIVSGLAEDALRRKNEELNASYEQIAAAEEELRGNLDEMTRAELALRENEERYHQFFKTTLDSVFITTANGQWVDCNDALVEVFGYESREDVFSVPVFSFYAHPEERSEFLKVVEQEGFVKERPLQFKKKDGTVIDGLITIVPQKNHDGSLKGFIGTFHTITGKKRVHALVSNLEQFNQGRVEDLPDYIAVYGPDGKILYVNPAAVKALGYDAETMIGTSVLSYVAEEFREIVAVKMMDRYETGGLPIYETNLITRDGHRRLVIVKGTQVLFHNSPATLLLIIDITRRKTLEDELTARAAELSIVSTAFRQANKKLVLLSSITRHDINNQLTIILGYLDIMGDMPPGPLLDEYLRKVSNAARRISSMIQFTKEYEDIGVSDPAWQDCRVLVNTASTQAQLGKVIVDNGFPAGTEVFADPLVVKVFYNLMDNAVRYGGKITFIRFSARGHEGNLVLVCEDDGDGVPAEEKEKIFERGFGKNTGLGLALSREILSLSGITITENGDPSEGARFEIMVPKGMWRMAANGA